MFCKNCGRQLPDNATFCPGCGTKRSGGDHSYEDGRSSADIKNLPSYAKENDRSGHAVDSDRKKFSLTDSGQKKFSLSDSGRDKFSLSDKSRKDDGDGIVRISASREPAAPPKEPSGFVNPLKEAGRDIHWGSDGDRNQQAEDVGEIDSHMGFAIFVTVLGLCNCLNLVLGITAIVFASQVQKYIEEGNFEQARKSSNTAKILCWISLGLMLLGLLMSLVSGALSAFFEAVR